jgi:hypothetical protein
MAKIKAFLSVLLIAVIVVSGLALTKNVRVANAQTFSDDWTMFHYDPAHTGYTPSQALINPPLFCGAPIQQALSGKLLLQ